MNLITDIHKTKLTSNLYLLAIIFIEGFVTISAEMLTIRQLIPQVGNNVVVTSLIIGVFLLFLAYGYRKGGTYQKDYLAILQNNFFKSALLIGFGLSNFFIAIFFEVSLKVFYQNMFIALLVYLFMITAPLVYFLGQTVPITTNLYQQGKSVAIVSSRVLHLSTLGSFLGAVITTLILMNYLGIAWTVFINFALLLGLSLVNNLRDRAYLTVLLGTTVFLFILNVLIEKRNYVVTNNYADYQIISPTFLDSKESVDLANNSKLLKINASNSSWIDDNHKAFPYIETIKNILFNDLQLTGKNILVLGAGGFTLSAETTQGNHFTYVDIDKDLNHIVEPKFLDSIKGDFVGVDARVFAARTNQVYDVVVSDTYSNKLAIPYHLITREHLLNIRRVLTKSGIAIFNIVAKPSFEDAYSKRLDSTLRSVFSSCVVIPSHYSELPTNLIYVCKKSPREQDKVVYTDNINSATIDYFHWKNEV